jgi:hypothetical protein
LTHDGSIERDIQCLGYDRTGINQRCILCIRVITIGIINIDKECDGDGRYTTIVTQIIITALKSGQCIIFTEIDGEGIALVRCNPSIEKHHPMHRWRSSWKKERRR